MKAALIGFIVIIVIGGGAAYVTLHRSASTAPSSTPTQSRSNGAATGQTSAATITYSSQGFSPSLLTVPSGSTVTVKNTSSEQLQLDSNPHPVHTDDTDLNVGAVAPGQSKTFVVTKKGTFGYHNHLAPGDQGRITIE